MSNDIKIEKGVPMPAPTKWALVVAKWEIGDSVCVPSLAEVNTLRAIAWRHKQRITCRKDGEVYRAWRTIRHTT